MHFESSENLMKPQNKFGITHVFTPLQIICVSLFIMHRPIKKMEGWEQPHPSVKVERIMILT
jgi:hypothetical protein